VLAPRLVRNILANWLALGVATIVGFFLTPFMLRHLGDTGFGLWVLVTTLTGYYGLLDFGLRNSTSRFVAHYAANDDATDLGRVVSTALFTNGAFGILVLAIAGVVAWNLDLLLTVPGDWTHTARGLVLVFGVGSALGFPLNLFGHVLEGFQRFTWIGGVQATLTVVRAGLTVWVLSHGYGVLAVGVVTLATTVAGSLIYAGVVHRIYPQLRVRWASVDRAMFRQLAGFGLVACAIGVAAMLRFQADALVIGAFLSVQAVAHYSIASKLIFYVTDVVQAMAWVFTPVFSHLDAKRDLRRLGQALVKANRYSSFVAFPLTAFVAVAGQSLISVWVGSRYVSSYPVLLVLLLPTSLYLAQAGSPKLLYGMARHSVLAVVFLLEGVANLVLSIALVRRYGLLGVALGTAIPMAITSLFVLPLYVCRLLGLRLSAYLWDVHGQPLLLSLPLALFLWHVDGWLQPSDYRTLVAELALGALFYGGELLVLACSTEGVRDSLSWFWARLSERSASR
jgi:O-antigen/teichoic acid export membrane protein